MSNELVHKPKIIHWLPLLFIGIGMVGPFQSLLRLQIIELSPLFPVFKICLAIGSLGGLSLMIKDGTFIETVFFRITLAFISIIIVGAMFKFIHWPGANLMLIAGFICIPPAYLISFVGKFDKQLLDYLKAIWVVANYTIGILILMNWIENYYTIIPTTLLLITYLMYLKDKAKMPVT